ncbi:MAG: sigma-54-dependent Fis family transcriptional regulator [Candidatus Eisenbacteria bacterium]|nr:sigma-54-dependent Fis family transcriptional regulator [Candidatus Eisenbacteria bacterium]
MANGTSDHILVVDDEKGIQTSLRRILEYEGYEVSTASNGEQALDSIRAGVPSLVLLDIKMPGMDGIEVLGEAMRIRRELVVIMISGHGTVGTAVEATKLGAYDFLEKPLDRDRLLLTVRNALEQRRLSMENLIYREAMEEKYRIVGESAAIQSILRTIEKVGPTNGRVLITGANGTGKELVARALHNASPRARRPFVEVNCAAIPEELIESELFGHEKGSFTGATSMRIGKFELANGGTLFLDEIGDMSLSAQSKVLRVLETGEVTRVGGSRTKTVDVRVLSATNKDIIREVREGRFREDLYYRLNVVPIQVPSLAERREDIPILVRYFLERYSAENGIRPQAIDDAVLDRLAREREWPGNVRELRNTIERMIILSEEERISVEDIPPLGERGIADPAAALAEGATFQDFKEQAEKSFLLERLDANNWSVSRTARDLGMQRSNIYKKIEKYGLRRPSPGGDDRRTG